MYMKGRALFNVPTYVLCVTTVPSLTDYQSTTTAAFTTEGDAILPNSLTLTRLVKLGLIKPILNANLFLLIDLAKRLTRELAHTPSFST